ncbi:class I SAM-dependent methyltransferase [Rhodobacteraceae bacterium DSL-40]|uniref:class I SAM-dependent methyltransferase n=1 Tax=Amaricoccus sp. B4 TaxID=3368557 RepID=UPI000DAD6325
MTLAAPPYLDFETVLSRALGSLQGLRVLDMGAGRGDVTRRLAAAGADVTGVEPSREALDAAVQSGGGPSYVLAGAEATGLASAAFDLVFFSKSLHHCPDMTAALVESIRLLRPAGRIAVLEPVSPDPFWPVMRHVDDESAVHAEAVTAIEAQVAGGFCRREAQLLFATKFRTESVDALVELLLSVDPRRRLDAEGRAAMERAFATACETDAVGRFIPHWLRLDVLRAVA